MNIESYLFDNKWNKLIKPLEEYLLELAKRNPIYKNFNVNLPGVSVLGVHETILISEKFGFIEWLVREGKIDYWSEGWRNTPNYYVSYEWRQKIVNDIERLIIHLSIQDNPVEFLVSILK